jgi:SAM-dependent methyltransferase
MLSIDQTRLQHVRMALDDLHYDTLQRTLRPDYYWTPYPVWEEFKAAIAGLSPPLRTCFTLLLLAEPVPLADAQAQLGGRFIEDLLALGVLEQHEEGMVRTAGFSLLSYGSRYLLVSIPPTYPTCRDKTMPVYIGSETYVLAQELPYSTAPDTVLDLCAGSGALAILIAPSSRRVIATDLNAEAVAAARFNIALNGLETRVEVRQGDLYTPVSGQRFDFIVANAPFVPVPAGADAPMYGDGGDDGMRVLGPLLDGLDDHLTTTGRAVLYLVGMGDQQAPFILEPLETMARRDRFSVDVLVISRLAIKDVLLLRAAALVKDGGGGLGMLPRWQAMYRRSGAQNLAACLLYIRRGEPTVRLLEVQSASPT